jgi:hypothetical protein
MNDGIEIILARMETHPEEFYDDSGKWKFMYKEYFRDVMTEEEKAALHTKLKQVRRTELTSKVMDIMSEKMVTSKIAWEEREMLGVTQTL